MSWQLILLDEALRRCPKGRDEPYVIHPHSHEWLLCIDEMRDQLEESARSARTEAERSFEQWAKEGHWRRLKRRPSWLIQEILYLAQSEAEAGRSSWEIPGGIQDQEDPRSATFRAWSKRWFDVGLRAWAQEAAEMEYRMRS